METSYVSAIKSSEKESEFNPTFFEQPKNNRDTVMSKRRDETILSSSKSRSRLSAINEYPTP
jgi:hypothetical protein